jgi:glycosyltransferase involved in cell wall biosynthesis
MGFKKVSVVIPVYNSEDHLMAAFDSLARQTMHASDFEIICVNDCSTDNSRQVIEKCAATMQNLRLINLPKNTGGPMIPRNTGMDVASGKYIHFMDSDDFLGEEALERLYNAAEKYQSDIIFGRYVGVNGRYVPKYMFDKNVLPQADIVANRLTNSLAPHKMIRASFMKRHNIRFYEEAKAPNEDQWVIMQCYVKASVITAQPAW